MRLAMVLIAALLWAGPTAADTPDPGPDGLTGLKHWIELHDDDPSGSDVSKDGVPVRFGPGALLDPETAWYGGEEGHRPVEVELVDGSKVWSPTDADEDDGCGDVTAVGQCDGSILSWCEGGAVKTEDCQEAGLVCGFNSTSAYWDCLEPKDPSAFQGDSGVSGYWNWIFVALGYYVV